METPASSPPVTDIVYFLHIPRTAGTTLASYLESGFHPRDVCDAYDWPELLALPEQSLADYRLIRSHFGAMLIDLLPRPPAVVTMLRDPVGRAVSVWRYIRAHPSHPAHPDFMRHGPDLLSFVRNAPPNVQARDLAVDKAPPELLSRIRASGSRQEIWRVVRGWTSRQPDLLERATDRLERCLAFGLVERFDESVHLLATRLGWRPPGALPRLNAAPPGDDSFEPSAEVVEAVLERDALDVELYAHARRRFELEWNSLQAEWPEPGQVAAPHFADVEAVKVARLMRHLADPPAGRDPSDLKPGDGLAR